MFSQLQTRDSARALLFASVVGIGMSAVLGGAFVAGGLAEAAVHGDQSDRLQWAAKAGLSDAALQHLTAGMGPGALALAQRQARIASVGPAHAAMAAMIAEREAAVGASSAPQAVTPQTITQAVAVMPSRPFHLEGALESSRELDCMTDAVYYEARGEGAAGEAAVAQVVLNRVRHPAFPKSVCSVVFQGAAEGACQFSFACDGAMRRTREPGAWDRARGIAARALSGYVMDAVGRATHFHTASLGALWGDRMVRVAQVGQHVFYRFGGHGGTLGYGGSTHATTAEDETGLVVADVSAPESGLVKVATAAIADSAPTGAAVKAMPEAAAKDRPAPATSSATAPATVAATGAS